MTSSGILIINITREGSTQRFQDKEVGSVRHNILVTLCARIDVSLSVTNVKTFFFLFRYVTDISN